jgi:hypothetical protein
MKNSPLLKYKIGLGLIAALTVVLLVMVVGQSSAVKHDRQVYKKASEVADKLNSFTALQGKVPVALAQLQVKDVPQDITYKRLTSTSYKFCTTYKAKGDIYGSQYIETQLLTAGHASDMYDTGDGGSFLYINPAHKKGQQCQTIKTYDYNTDYNYDSTDTRSF